MENNNNKPSRVGEVIGQAMVVVLAGCITAVLIAVTIRLICWTLF